MLLGSKEKVAMNKTDRTALVKALEGMAEELRRLAMAQGVQRAALELLARHLATQGHARLDTLAQDMETMASVHSEPEWNACFSEMASMLRLMREQASPHGE
jgi:phage replication-related protein YjqB (UPF0714/DUF867 family)